MNGQPLSTPPGSTAQGALARLAASRALLAVALRGEAESTAGRHTTASAPGERSTPSAPFSPLATLSSLASQGVVQVLAERWRRSPWNLSLQLADQAAAAVLQPLAQRHPVGLVLAAGAVGGLVTLGKPWRWVRTTSLLAALWPLVGRAIAQAAPAKQRPRA